MGALSILVSFHLNKTDIKVEHHRKYLGVKLVNKFSFRAHIDHVQSKLSIQCGILAKLRHYVPRNQLISYYNSNVTPIIQYGALVYGCCMYSALLRIFLLQKKIKSNIFLEKKAVDVIYEALDVNYLGATHIRIY